MPTPTGEVFRTLAPGGANTSWRLYHGGSGATNEVGQFFSIGGSLAPDLHLNINAPNGQIRLLTSGVIRVRVNGPLLGQMVNGFPGLNLSGFLGVGNFSSAYTRPVARVHSENGSSLDWSYRPMMGEGFLAT